MALEDLDPGFPAKFYTVGVHHGLQEDSKRE